MRDRPDVVPAPHRVLDPVPDQVGVSYVMPVLNEAGHLRVAVQAILDQAYEGESEVVLALGASSDGTDEIAAELADSDQRITLVHNPDNDIPKGLNLAIAASRFPIVVRVDAHAELPPGYTTAMVDLLRRSRAANAGGVMVARGRTPFQQAVARAYNSPFGLGGGVYHHGEDEVEADSAYLGVFRREVLTEVGGFDEGLRRGEDWELNHRIRSAGHRVIFTPAVEVTYWPRDTPDGLRRQMYATGVWRGHIVRRMKGTPVRYLPPPLVAILVAGAVVATVLQGLSALGGQQPSGWRWLGWLFQAGGLGYLAGALTVGATRLGGDRWSDRLLSGAVLVIMHLSWGAGFLRGYLLGARSIVDRSRVR